MIYKAQIYDETQDKYIDVILDGEQPYWQILKQLRKLAKIDLRKGVSAQKIDSEISPIRWGIFYWKYKIGRLLAFVEFEDQKLE